MDILEEIKIHKNKETQKFLCEVLRRDEGFLVLRYRAPSEGNISDIFLKKGSTTIAYYWADRGYILWRIFHPDGALAGNLFHICRDVLISPKSISYLDLIIDVWISPDNAVRILDEDELEECKRAGLLNGDELRWIETQKKILLTDYCSIIRDAVRIETIIKI